VSEGFVITGVESFEFYYRHKMINKYSQAKHKLNLLTITANNSDRQRTA